MNNESSFKKYDSLRKKSKEVRRKMHSIQLNRTDSFISKINVIRI